MNLKTMYPPQARKMACIISANSLCTSKVQRFRRSVNRLFVLVPALILWALPAFSQVPVSVGPEPKTQFLDNSGAPLASGIVCTYAAGTSTPQATYTDSTGTVMNSNPIVLDSAGRANIWWQAAAYKVVLAGGGTCASPSNLMWTVDGFQVGVFLNGNNTWTGTNTFNGTVTVNAAANLTSGGSMNGTFSGNPNFSGSPTFSGTIVASQFQSTVATGTPPLIISSTTLVPNLNVSTVDGCVISGSASANTFLEATGATTCSWANATQFPAVLYTTPSSSVNANIGATTMATVGASDATYRFGFYVQLSVVGSGCTGSTTVTPNLIFQDPLGASPSTANFSPGLVLATANGTLGPSASFIGNTYTGMAAPFRAKAGTVIQYSVTYSLGSTCSPGPKYVLYPILEQLTAN